MKTLPLPVLPLALSLALPALAAAAGPAAPDDCPDGACAPPAWLAGGAVAPAMAPGKSAFLVTGDPSRNKVLTVPGGGFATVKIELPAAWDALMAERGYAPLASFRLAPAASSAPAASPPSALDGARRGPRPAPRRWRRPEGARP